MIATLKNGWRWYSQPYQFLDEALRREALTFRLSLPLLGPALLTGEPRLIQEIVANKDLQGGKGISALRTILGNRSLIMLDGSEHLERRRLIASFLRGDRLAAYDSLTRTISLEEIGKLACEQPFSVYHLSRKIALKVIIRVIFGRLPEAEAASVEAMIEAFLTSFDNALILFLKPLHLNLGRFSPWGRALQRRDRLVRYIVSRINQADPPAPYGGREDPPAPYWGREDLPVSYGGREPESLLDHMLRCSAGKLTVDEIAAEILALLLFGHDTGAATMAWAMAHIYQDQASLARLQQELALTDDPEAMHFLEACLNESMRLCPVVVHLTRVAARETKVGGYQLKAGDVVIPCTYLAQHHPAIFEAPEQFRPERFLGGQSYPYAFFPFGLGSRTCVGKPLVLRQMLLIASTLIKHERLTLAPGYEPQPARHMVLIVPKEGTLMIRKG
jgi:unspecific monooxygenase